MMSNRRIVRSPIFEMLPSRCYHGKHSFVQAVKVSRWRIEHSLRLRFQCKGEAAAGKVRRTAELTATHNGVNAPTDRRYASIAVTGYTRHRITMAAYPPNIVSP